MSMYSDNQNSGAAGWLVGAVKNNPEGLLLLAAGCALLMRSSWCIEKPQVARRSRIRSQRHDAKWPGSARPNGRRKTIRDCAKRRRVCLGHRRERC